MSIDGFRPTNVEHKDWPGEYCEPDWNNLGEQMLNAFDNYKQYKSFAMAEAKELHDDFNWDKIAKGACNILERNKKPFAFVTTGNLQYMHVIEKLVQ